MTDEFRWYLLFLRRYEKRLVEAFGLFRNNGIEPLLIKGWAAARNYPEGIPRYFTDIDLAVSSEDFQKARTLGLDAAANGLGIDLHNELRHLDTLPWADLFRTSIEIDLNRCPIRVLSQENHLRVLCVHWLMDGGEYKERLWDVYFAVSNRPSEFDWSRCLDVVSPRRQKWVIAVIGLAHKYLGLDISGLPYETEAQNLPNWLLRTIEREWKRDVRLRPLQTCLSEPAIFLQQLRKRFPPNPIQATVDMEGEFDGKTRVFYQAGSILRRAAPSARRITREAFRRG